MAAKTLLTPKGQWEVQSKGGETDISCPTMENLKLLGWLVKGDLKKASFRSLYTMQFPSLMGKETTIGLMGTGL